MTGETVRDLLKPLIGRSGSVTLLVKRSGSIGFDMTENKKLTGVEVRPDGLIRLERQSGWTVIDPDEVIAVAWNGEIESDLGQFL
jgi:hypothetical protein